MAKKIWIVYKTESMSAPGWEERQLMPRGGLTNILWENWTWEENPEIPQVGDKTRDYENLSDPGNGVTHGKDGDWVVTRVPPTPSFSFSPSPHPPHPPLPHHLSFLLRIKQPAHVGAVPPCPPARDLPQIFKKLVQARLQQL